jgi:hypothetical protein
MGLTESLPNRGIQECITKPKAFGAMAFSTTITYSSREWAYKVKKFFEEISGLVQVIGAN